jgi:MYXO-CTERM domain-containing protein
LSGSKWSALGTGLPAVLVTSLKLAPDDPNVLYAATFGRGVYAYHFPKTAVLGEKKTRPATKPAKLPSTGLGTDVTAWALVAVAGALAVRLRRRRDPVL